VPGTQIALSEAKQLTKNQPDYRFFTAVEIVIETGEDTVVFPAASLATAVRTWVRPSANLDVLTVMEYGAEVAVPSVVAPSNLNSTFATPTLSEAEAETMILPNTLDPALGLVNATVGGMVSGNPLKPVVIRHPGLEAKPSSSYAPTSYGEKRGVALKSVTGA